MGCRVRIRGVRGGMYLIEMGRRCRVNTKQGIGDLDRTHSLNIVHPLFLTSGALLSPTSPGATLPSPHNTPAESSLPVNSSNPPSLHSIAGVMNIVVGRRYAWCKFSGDALRKASAFCFVSSCAVSCTGSTNGYTPHAPTYPILLPLSLRTRQTSTRSPISHYTLQRPDPFGCDIDVRVSLQRVDVFDTARSAEVYLLWLIQDLHIWMAHGLELLQSVSCKLKHRTPVLISRLQRRQRGVKDEQCKWCSVIL